MPQTFPRAPEGLPELGARIKAFTDTSTVTSSERLAETRQRNNRRAEVTILMELIGNFNLLADRLKNGRLSLQQDSSATRGALESEIQNASDAFYEPLTTRQFAQALAAIRTLQERLGPEPKAAAEGFNALEARLTQIGSISDQKAFAKAAEQLMIDARLELELLDRLRCRSSSDHEERPIRGEGEKPENLDESRAAKRSCTSTGRCE